MHACRSTLEDPTVRAAGGAGWLALDRPLQDVGLFAEFRCPPGCRAGVLLRGAQTPDGGWTGVFVDVSADRLGAYRARFDPQGRELARERLTPAPEMIRVAPAPTAPEPPPAAAAPSPRPAAPSPAGLPIVQPDRSLRPGEWNRLELLLDANILKALLNDGRALQGGVVDADGAGFGAVALVVMAGEARFRGVAWTDLAAKSTPLEAASPAFRVQRVEDFFYSWATAAADINRDGVADLISGPNAYLGPDYTRKREIALTPSYSATDDSPVFQSMLAHDFTGDGWPDILDASYRRPMRLYVNPQGQSRRWTSHAVTGPVGSEMVMLTDMDADGRAEVLAAMDGTLALIEPDPQAPRGPWRVRPVTERGPWGQHGLGVGDIDGDGRLDLVQAYGWWSQPAGGAGLWPYHPYAFGRAGRTAVGGAEMAVYDVDGDGLNDVVASLEAHGFGLAWFEQKRGAGGAITFERHMIMDGFDAPAPGGVVFTQLHGAAKADVDGDGVPDYVVGKRHWTHHESLTDPDSNGPAVVYAFKTRRDAAAPGGARFEPELIHNRSGAGSQIVAQDLDRDGVVDLATSGDRGAFIFWGRARSAP